MRASMFFKRLKKLASANGCFIHRRMRTLLRTTLVSLLLALHPDPGPGQELEHYTKVANRLVELINAEDYSGIQATFSKEMAAALPLDKSTAFFKDLDHKLGKIQKLDPPRTPP